MKALSQSDYGLIRSLYQDVYAPDIAESILDEFTDEDLDDLTDEYIEEQVIEFFQECLEEGLDIDIVEQTICESVDTELEILTEVTNPAQVAAMRMRDKTSAASGEGQKSDRDAGAAARAKLKVSKQKVGSASPEKKASKLSQIKGAVKKVGQAAKGAVGLAGRSISTAKRAGSSLKTSFKKGYERGKGSPQTSSSSSSDSGSSSSSSSSDSGASSSGTGPSSSSSSGGGSSSATPKKRKDGLLKRGLKKVVRGITKGVSAAAGAVKAGADSLTDRARKEDMNYNKELATIKELYRQVCNHQEEEPEQLDEADSLAAMQARGEKVLAAQRKRKRREDNMKKEEVEQIAEMGKSDQGVRDRIAMFKNSKIEYTPPTNWDKDANRGKGATVSPKQAEKRRRKSLRQEELESTGLFTAKEIEALVESENVDEAMSSYDRNRKRAAQRAADRNAARAAGKTGVVPGVGYVTPRREKETYTDEKGTVRHKSGAKNEEFEQLDEISKKLARNYLDKSQKDIEARRERGDKAMKRGDTQYSDTEHIKALDRERGQEQALGKIGHPFYPTKVPATGEDPNRPKPKEKSKGLKGLVKKLTRKEELELDENRRAARAAGGYKDDSKKQTDPSKAGFTGISNSIADIMRQNKEIEARKKKSGAKNEELEHLDEVSDRKVRAVRDAREKQWNKQFGKNRVKDPTDDMTDKVDKLIDQRNKRTGSKVKKTTMGQLTDKHRKEELEHLDEISKKTLGSYVKKASKDVEKRSYDQGQSDSEEGTMMVGFPPQSIDKDKKIDKRQKGIGRAVGKLTK